VDYVEMRRRTFGSTLTMTLARISAGPAVPPEIYQSPTIQTLEAVASDYACLCNDIFSYQKEMEFEGEVHNAVLAVRQFFRCGTRPRSRWYRAGADTALWPRAASG